MLRSDGFRGTTKVFANTRKKADGTEFIQYSTSLGKKNADGTWDNTYINLQFKKGAWLPDEHMFDINVLNSFLSFDNRKNAEGKITTYYKIVVMEFELENDSAPARTTPPPVQDMFMGVDDDCPF